MVWVKCNISIVLDSLRNFINLKQKEDENLVDYVTRFKSAKNVLKSLEGSDILHKFVEHMPKYGTASGTEQQAMKDESFDRWMAFLLIKNSNQSKYGSLITGLSSQYSLLNNQYPNKVTSATDIMVNHKHDSNSRSRNGRNQKNHKDDKTNEKREESSSEKSFAQGR